MMMSPLRDIRVHFGIQGYPDEESSSDGPTAQLWIRMGAYVQSIGRITRESKCS